MVKVHAPGVHSPSENRLRVSGGVMCIAGVALFLIVVVALHVVRRDYDPLQQMMSELALGQHGGFMLVAFLGFGSAFAGLAAGLRGARQPVFTILLAAATALAFSAAGIYRLDNAVEAHVALVAIAFVLAGLLMYLLPSSLPGLARSISWMLAAATALAVVSGHLFAPMGLAQRLAAACILIWLVWVGTRLIKA